MHSPRAQADKKLYQFTMKNTVESQPGLTLRQEMVEGLYLGDRPHHDPSEAPRRVLGVVARGETLYRARAVILTTGTFLKAIMHTGEAKTRGGRAGDGTAESLSDSLASCGFQLARFKTGTPCRLNGRTIDFARTRAPARRRRSPAVQLRHRAHHPATDGLPHHLHERGGPRPDPRATCTARRCTPGRSRAADRATAPRSRTRWCASPTRTGTRSSWSRRAGTRWNITATASAPACPRTCSRPCCS